MADRIILRDWNRTEHDDWALNVQPRMGEKEESIPLYLPKAAPEDKEVVAAWAIRRLYE